MAKHAFLSASSSHRWLNCPPSAALCASEENTSSEYAKQGTEAHELCQYKVERALGKDASNPTTKLDYFSPEMDDCTDNYCSYVLEQLATAKKLCNDPEILIEQRLDFSKWVPDGFGTGDCVIVADQEIHIIDYKHGLGVLVSAENNSQMMCYALGALDLFDSLYDIRTVKMTIFQPRRDNVSTHTLSKDELLKWANEVLAPTAQLALQGQGEFKAGDHCQFCKVKATCRKRAEENMKLAQYDFEMPIHLDDTEITAILTQSDELVSWVNDIKEYALRQALGGKQFAGFKVVEGRSTRKYTDEEAVAFTVRDHGYYPFEKKLLGVTAMTSLLGKKKFEELLGSLVVKTPGKPTLVPDTDKRPALNSAKEDFKNE